MLTLTRNGVILPTDQDTETWREEYQRTRVFIAKNLLSSDLGEWLLEQLEKQKFHRKSHGEIGVEDCLDPDSLVTRTALFLLNRPEIFRFLERLTGCERIGSFKGRVYRFRAGAGHEDSWHNDLGDGRLLGISLNLSSHPYEGGLFQMRRERDKKILREVQHEEFGAAHIFEISKELRHQVTPLEGESPRVCMAGWFVSQSVVEYLSPG